MSNNSANPSLNPSLGPSRNRSVSGHYSLSNPPTEAELKAILSVMSSPGRETLAAHSRMHDVADAMANDDISKGFHHGVALQTQSLFRKEAIKANERYAATSQAANTAVPPTDTNSAQSPPPATDTNSTQRPPTVGSQNKPVFGPERPPTKDSTFSY